MIQNIPQNIFDQINLFDLMLTAITYHYYDILKYLLSLDGIGSDELTKILIILTKIDHVSMIEYILDDLKLNCFTTIIEELFNISIDEGSKTVATYLLDRFSDIRVDFTMLQRVINNKDYDMVKLLLKNERMRKLVNLNRSYFESLLLRAGLFDLV